MKNLYKLFPGIIITSVFLSFPGNPVFAQCNVNDKYDKIISGYHSSIALKDNGVYAVWGSDMKSTGAADQLAPQDMNATNYPALTGTIYKAALGGKSAGAAVDQGILLTSDGLWAWGIVGNVLKSTVKATAAFGRITSPAGGVGSTVAGLPTGVTPTDVQSIYATYQTLIILTKIVSNVGGDVYILIQSSLAAEANGGVVATAGSSTWQRVKINAGTFLTNVTAVRGQVFNTTNNAFIALTTAGLAYTWGNTSYSGSGVSAARNFATSMTLPTESAVTIVPKMIGVTGGGGTGATTVKNTYYVLSNSGNLYSLGDNSQKQCGDFTTTERTAWVQVKKSAAANDFLTNINFFSCQEHNASFPCVAAITTTGNLYTWGNNSSGMVGRTDDGTMGGALTIVSFDPGTPAGFTGIALSVEMGGHTMVYLKEGSSQFCYVGHYTNGSMGDGTAGNNGASSATSLKHDCSSTPSISICGFVPVAGSIINSAISASLSSIQADGSSISIITVRLKDASNNNLTSSGGTVVITASTGTLGTITDNNDGTYTVTLTSSSSPGTATLGFSINGTTAGSTTQVAFVATTLPLTWINVLAFRQNKAVKITWTTATEVNVKSFQIERSANGNDWNVVISGIPASVFAGNNHYEQTDTSFNPKKLYYRIRQEDLDGRYTYSSLQMVPAFSAIDKISIYPVPANNSFHLSNTSPGKIKGVQLIALNGSLLKSWNQYQTAYNIQEIPAGNYIVRIETTGDVQVVKLKKQ